MSEQRCPNCEAHVMERNSSGGLTCPGCDWHRRGPGVRPRTDSGGYSQAQHERAVAASGLERFAQDIMDGVMSAPPPGNLGHSREELARKLTALRKSHRGLQRAYELRERTLDLAIERGMALRDRIKELEAALAARSSNSQEEIHG